MTKSKRGRYTLEFKQEAARLVESGQSQAAVARSLGEALFRRIIRFANSE
jgi:transposase